MTKAPLSESSVKIAITGDFNPAVHQQTGSKISKALEGMGHTNAVVKNSTSMDFSKYGTQFIEVSGVSNKDDIINACKSVASPQVTFDNNTAAGQLSFGIHNN